MPPPADAIEGAGADPAQPAAFQGTARFRLDGELGAGAGGLGVAMGGAIGQALAHRGSGRFFVHTSGDGEWTIVLFAHAGWREPVEFMNHCSTKWAIFLMSLKSLLETEKGTPNPHDPNISGDGPD